MYLDRLEFKNDPLNSFPLKSKAAVPKSDILELPPLSGVFCFDLRCRVISAFLLIAAAVTVSNYYILALLVLMLLFFLIKSIRIVLLRLIPVNIFTLMLWVTLPLYDAFTFTLRINAAALLYMLFLIPIGISGLSNALAKIGVPNKLVSLLILSYRFIFVMFERVYIAVSSMRLRQSAGRTMREQWRSYAAVFAASFLSAEFRSQKIWRAMYARGFDGTFPITKTFRWKLPDTFLLAISVIFAVCLPLLDRN